MKKITPAEMNEETTNAGVTATLKTGLISLKTLAEK